MTKLIATQGQDEVELVPSCFEFGLPAGIPGRSTGRLNKLHDAVPASLPFLTLQESVKEPPPLCRRGLGVVDLTGAEQLPDF